MEKENVLFISDIDRTLIFPKRFARDRDVCIEWTQDGKELNYINPGDHGDLHVVTNSFPTRRSSDLRELDGQLD